MSRYFVKSVDPALLPDSKPWAFCDMGDDVYFCVPDDGRAVEIRPEVLEDLLDKVRAAYARSGETAA